MKRLYIVEYNIDNPNGIRSSHRVGFIALSAGDAAAATYKLTQDRAINVTISDIRDDLSPHGLSLQAYLEA